MTNILFPQPNRPTTFKNMLCWSIRYKELLSIVIIAVVVNEHVISNSILFRFDICKCYLQIVVWILCKFDIKGIYEQCFECAKPRAVNLHFCFGFHSGNSRLHGKAGCSPGASYSAPQYSGPSLSPIEILFSKENPICWHIQPAISK